MKRISKIKLCFLTFCLNILILFPSCNTVADIMMPEGEIILLKTIENMDSSAEVGSKKLTDVTKFSTMAAVCEIISAEYDKEYKVDELPEYLILKFKIKEIIYGEYESTEIEIKIRDMKGRLKRNTFKEGHEYLIPFWLHNEGENEYYTIPSEAYIDLNDYEKSAWYLGEVKIPEGYKREHIIKAFKDAVKITGIFDPDNY
ncbi:MAG: hypothetical protein E7564_10845 [Ruminococcaceae bacterium]|nr:hypothetical protein [Oscillospiraceae bacterium]